MAAAPPSVRSRGQVGPSEAWELPEILLGNPLGNLHWEEAHSFLQKDMQIGLWVIKVGRGHDATKGKQRTAKDGPEQPGP